MLTKEFKDQFYVVGCFIEQFKDILADCDDFLNKNLRFKMNNAQVKAIESFKKDVEIIVDKYLK